MPSFAMRHFASWLKQNYPRDLLIPMGKNGLPKYSYKNQEWSWSMYLRELQVLDSHRQLFAYEDFCDGQVGYFDEFDAEFGFWETTTVADAASRNKNKEILLQLDVGLLLNDICVVVLQGAWAEIDELQTRFTEMMTAPCEKSSSEWRFYFARSSFMDCEGYYDCERTNEFAPMRLKTIGENGTPGFLAVTPSKGMAWLPGRAPWECCATCLPTISDKLLGLHETPRHPSTGFELHISGDVKKFEAINPLSGSAYINCFLRPPLGFPIESVPQIPLPTCFSLEHLEDLLEACDTGEPPLNNQKSLDSLAERVDGMHDLASYLGIPRVFDSVFLEPSGTIHARKRLWELSPFAVKAKIEENLWQQSPVRSHWKSAVVKIDDEVVKQEKCLPLTEQVYQFRLFPKTPVAATSFQEGDTVLTSDSDHRLPPIIYTILKLGAGKTMLAGGSVLSFIGKKCGRPGDYDFFFYGISCEEATGLLTQITSECGLNSTYESNSTKSFDVYDSDTRNFILIQFIKKIFVDPTDVLHFFDISACKVGLLHESRQHPTSIWATPTWMECIRTKTVWFDDCEWSVDLPTRLFKYYCKGFDIILPAKSRQILDSSLDFSKPIMHHQGIAQVLAIEYQFEHQFKVCEEKRRRNMYSWMFRLDSWKGQSRRYGWADVLEFFVHKNLYRENAYRRFDFELRAFSDKICSDKLPEWIPMAPTELTQKRWKRRIICSPSIETVLQCP